MAVAETVPSKGDQLANAGNYKAAAQAFAAAHKAAPGNAEITARLARATLMAGEHKKAVEWAQKAISLDPDSATYQLLLGDAYANYVNDVGMFSKLGVVHKLRDAYLKAVELEPGNPQAHMSLAMYYLMAPGIAGGSDDKGNAQLRQLDRLDPAMADTGRAIKAMQDDKQAQAEALMNKAVAHAHDSAPLVSLGASLVSRKRVPEGLAALRKAIETYPTEPAAYYQVGKLAADGMVDAQEGIEAMHTYLGMAIDWRQGDAPLCWAHYRLAQILERQGEAQKAKGEYQLALKLNPDFPKARQALQKLVSSRHAAGSVADHGA